jgi:glycosyltransferase involved in cell wall biosynthesis
MTDETSAVAVIVPCSGHAVELARCLEALCAQDAAIDVDLVVVDSAGDDAVRQCVESFPGVRLVRGESTQLGPGAARNAGVRATRAEKLLFCDADCAPEPGWLAGGIKALEQGHALVTGPVGDLLARPVAIADNLLQFVDFSPNRPPGRVTHAPGCNLAVRRSDFESAGGFADGIGEDVRLSQNIAPDGAWFEPDMRQRHLGRRTIRDMLAHHRSFGLARGQHGLLLKPWHRRLGGLLVFQPFVVLKRYAYIVKRTIQYRPMRLPLVALLSPLLLPGLWAWATGFRHGLEASTVETHGR